MKAGETAEFLANLTDPRTAVSSYKWDFGDGITVEGAQASHTYTRPGMYRVTLNAIGVDGLTGEARFLLPVMGYISTKFVPAEKQRYHAQPDNR
jgi:chitodextrinase